MTRHFALLLLCLLFSACSSLPGRQANVDAVMAASGLDAQINQLATPLTSEGLEGPLALIPDEWIALVNSTIAENVKPEQIRGSLRDRLGKGLSGSELRAVQDFYESATGQRVVALESGKDLGNVLPAVANRQTLDALAEATGYGRAAGRLAEHGLNDAIDVAVKNRCFGLDQVPFANAVVGVVKRAQLAALRESVNSMIRERHARLSAQEQADYLAFARSTPGRKFLEARTQVLMDTAQRTGSALSSQLGQQVLQVCMEKQG